MAATIKLMRIGKRGYSSYRIVVIDKRKKRSSRYIEKIGFYDPNTNPMTININKDKVKDWLAKGAMVADGVRKLLKKGFL